MLTSYGETMPKEIDGVTYYTSDEIYMDQTQVDKAIRDRLERVEKKPEDYDDIKSEIAELRNASGRLQAELDAKREEMEQAVEAARQEQRDELLPEVSKSRIQAAAVQKGFRNAEDAITFYGEIPADLNEEAIANRLSEIATERSYLLSSDPTPSASDVGVGVAGAGTAPAQPGLHRVEAALEPK